MKSKIAIIGGGTAGLCFASAIDTKKFDAVLFEKNSKPGRKLLVAGKGGFNLSHSEPIKDLISRYTPSTFLEKALETYDNVYLRDWFKQNGIPTFIGTSQRIFPLKKIKPITVLNAIVKAIEKNGVKILTDHEWTGFSPNSQLNFKHQSKIITKQFDYVVFALGGGSWKITGSAGDWTSHFKSISCQPFLPSNCAYKVDWPKSFIQLTEGKPLKNIVTRSGSLTKKGELMITAFGLEGGAIYALSPQLRHQLITKGEAELLIDLKPDFSVKEIIEKLNTPHHKNRTAHVQSVLNLEKEKIKLLKAFTDIDLFNDNERLAKNIKGLSIQIVDFAPLDEAISTVGGIPIEAINAQFELNTMPNHFVIGEMLDWDAPTGGYLIQACFSMGLYLADQLNKQ